MTIDAAKKTSLEKKIVVGLLILFGLTFSGALRGMIGTHGGARVTAPVLPVQPVVAQSFKIRPAMTEAIQRTEEVVATQMRVPAAPSDRNTPSGEPLYTAQTLRDPMKSLLPAESPKVAALPSAPNRVTEAPPQPPPSLRVRGILWGGKDAQAIINDKVYRVGDTVAGVKILSIDRRGVTVEYRGEPMMYTTAAPATDAGRAPAQQARWR